MCEKFFGKDKKKYKIDKREKYFSKYFCWLSKTMHKKVHFFYLLSKKFVGGKKCLKHVWVEKDFFLLKFLNVKIKLVNKLVYKKKMEKKRFVNKVFCGGKKLFKFKIFTKKKKLPEPNIVCLDLKEL